MTSEKVRAGYRLARNVQLAMTMFNIGTSGAIFSHKLLGLCGGIVSFYFLLRLIVPQPELSMLFFVLAFDSIFFYTAMWGNASLIPVMIKDLKDQLDIAATAGRGTHNCGYWRRESRSIPCTGVSVGGFRSMERDSSLIFIDFVVRNVVSLLVAFK